MCTSHDHSSLKVENEAHSSASCFISPEFREKFQRKYPYISRYLIVLTTQCRIGRGQGLLLARTVLQVLLVVNFSSVQHTHALPMFTGRIHGCLYSVRCLVNKQCAFYVYIYKHLKWCAGTLLLFDAMLARYMLWLMTPCL